MSDGVTVGSEVVPAATEMPPKAPISIRQDTRFPKVGTCVLTRDDLRKLYLQLDEISRDAVELQLKALNPKNPDQMNDYEAFCLRVRGDCGLFVVVDGGGGAQIVAKTVEGLAEDRLPDAIEGIHFESTSSPIAAGLEPQNKFNLTLDFRQPPPMKSYDPWNLPTPNGSQAFVQGTDFAWVSGADEKIRSFFSHRSRRREWLHSPTMFQFVNWLVGLPLAIWVAFRFDEWLITAIKDVPTALRIWWRSLRVPHERVPVSGYVNRS